MTKKSPTLMWYAILILVGAGLALILPANPTTLHAFGISDSTYHLAILTLVLPYALIWFTAFYAYGKLEQYASKVEATREGEAFKKVADGVRFLAWGLAIPTIIALLLQGVEHMVPHFRPARIIIDNYIGVAVQLVGFTLIADGTRSLTELVRARPSSIGIRTLAAVFIAIGVFFTYFIAFNQHRNPNSYYLPNVLLLLTIVVPYLYAWLVGLLGAYELRLYSQKTRGLLYQRALVWLAGGLTTVIIGSIIMEYLNGILVGVSSLHLGTFLALMYGLLIIQAFGYALVAFGAHQLKRIEEV